MSPPQSLPPSSSPATLVLKSTSSSLSSSSSSSTISRLLSGSPPQSSQLLIAGGLLGVAGTLGCVYGPRLLQKLKAKLSVGTSSLLSRVQQMMNCEGKCTKWFVELSPLWKGQCMSLEIDRILHSGRSKYQDIFVFLSKTYGKVLVLDGAIQCTEKDECSYQEMMAHLPLMSHPCPRKVLVIGGGDGGVLREVGRHSCVQEMHICEIDQEVIKVSQDHLPHMASVFNDPRVQVHVEDGAEFLKRRKNEFDVVIVDSSDPIGPASTLFQKSFYEIICASLKDGGIFSAQGECMWIHGDIIKDLILNAKRAQFHHVDYAAISIPTYPCGTIGVLCCSKGTRGCSEPMKERIAESENWLTALKYYTPQMHCAAFVLPAFCKEFVASK